MLILYPFGPAWSSEYPKEMFVDSLVEIFAAYGIEKHRLLVVDTLQNHQQILALQCLADIYLDALPYNGATSLLDPLSVGVPPIVLEGDQLRFRQGSAIMREIGLAELIASCEQEYIDMAVALSQDSNHRRLLNKKIVKCMKARPPFLDPVVYARQTARAFKKMVRPDKKKEPLLKSA